MTTTFKSVSCSLFHSRFTEAKCSSWQYPVLFHRNLPPSSCALIVSFVDDNAIVTTDQYHPCSFPSYSRTAISATTPIRMLDNRPQCGDECPCYIHSLPFASPLPSWNPKNVLYFNLKYRMLSRVKTVPNFSLESNRLIQMGRCK